MRAVLAPPRLRGPGLAWIPAVLRERATWRTVWRFAWAGPLIGGLPYVWMLVTIPFAYAIGVVPAALAGLLFAAWYHGHAGRAPTWPWRAAVGALSGLGAAALIGLATVLFGRGFGAFWMVVWALHGLPAAAVLGLMQRPTRTERAAGLNPSAA